MMAVATGTLTSPLSPKERSELLERVLTSDFGIPGEKANILKEALRTDSKQWSADSVYGFGKTAAKILIKKNLFDVFGLSLTARIVRLPFTAGMNILEDATSYREVAMRSVAYKVTAWAHNHGTPKPSEYVEAFLSIYLDARGRQAAIADAKRAWGEASDEAAKQMNRIVRQEFDYDENAAKEFLVLVGGRSQPQQLCRMILRFFEEIIRSTKLLGFIPGRGEHSAEYQGFKQANDRILYPN